MNTIIWITPRFFVETDIYAIQLLLNNFRIHWFIIEKTINNEYGKLIESISNHPNAQVEKILLPAQNRSFKCFLFYYRFLNRVNKMRPDLVYNPIFGMPYYMPLLSFIMKKSKTVVAIHNVTTPKGAKAPSVLSKLYTFFVTHAFKNYHTLSPSQCKILKSIAPRANVFFIPFVLKNYGLSSIKKSDCISFLFFGQILEYKRIDVLIEAAQKVYEKTHIPFIVKIAGNCPFWDKYQKLIKYPELFELNIRRIDNEEIPDLFVSSHYFVMPYQDIAQSGALMVAINYDLPVIASNIPAFVEYISDEENGYIIEPSSIEDLYQVMLKIVTGKGKDYNVLLLNMQQMKNKYFAEESIRFLYTDNFRKIIASSNENK